MKAIHYYGTEGLCAAKDYFIYAFEHMEQFQYVHPLCGQFIQTLLDSGFSRDITTFIDLASGPGTSAATFLRCFNIKNLILVDASQDMVDFGINYIKEVFSEDGVITTGFTSNLESETITLADSSVDFINCAYALCYLEKIDNFFSETARILRKDGYLTFNIEMHNENHSISMFEPKGCLGRVSADSFIHSRKKVVDLISQNFEIFWERDCRPEKQHHFYILKRK